MATSNLRFMAGGAALAAGLAALMLHARQGEAGPAPVAGMVRQSEIRLSSTSTGRLGTVLVKAGQRVTRGELLAVLDNPDLAASVEEARAALASAKADRERVFAGVRPEEVAMAVQAVKTAEANLVLARQYNTRAVALAARSINTRQQLDDSNASLAKARADLALKQAQLAAAQQGPVAEERSLMDAKVILAEASLADLVARLDKTKLLAPTTGTIGIRVAEMGEIMTPGKPILTMVADGERWFAFTLREDMLAGLAMHDSVSLILAGGRRVEARVTELRPLGEFATWRAAKAVGDHDLNSFRIRLEPVLPTDGLEPGMSAWLPVRK